jgi:hypothetical protein
MKLGMWYDFAVSMCLTLSTFECVNQSENFFMALESLSTSKFIIISHQSYVSVRVYSALSFVGIGSVNMFLRHQKHASE